MAGLAVKYLVKSDPDTGRWNVTRDGKPTGSFAREMETAIGGAIRETDLQARNSNLKIAVWLAYGGSTKKV
jgi:hypothetical protein